MVQRHLPGARPILAWAHRHVAEILLTVAGASSLTVTALSDVPEVRPWGHELGIGVSQLGFAYVGAYIFNWLIVERPRARALKGYYAAAERDLKMLAVHPANVVTLIADGPHVPWDGASRDTLLRILPHEFPSHVAVRELSLSNLRDDLDSSARRYQRLVPLLNQFDPEVSVAIAAMNPATVHGYLKKFIDHPQLLASEATRSLFAYALVEYQKAGRQLGQALVRAKHMPALSRDYYPRIEYAGLDRA